MDNYSFKQKCKKEIDAMGRDNLLRKRLLEWRLSARVYNYSYHFEWLGRPIIQLPQDIVAMQELIWQIKPDLIIEAGIAHGGSLIFNSSMLAFLDMCDAIEKGIEFNPKISSRKAVGIDIDIRAHNRAAIEAHPMISRIEMIERSSIDPVTISLVKEIASGYNNIMVCLDSNHTHDHVLAELDSYAPLVTKDSYCVVFDSVIEDMPADVFPDRPWGPGNNPKTAVLEYLKTHPEFEIDKNIQNKLLLTSCPDGYLRKIE